MSHDPGSLRTYVAIFGVLLALTGITVSVALLDLGVLNTVVALGIAFVKATLVMLFFMHVRGSERLVGIFAFAGVVWLSILLVFVWTDVQTRDWTPATAEVDVTHTE